MPEHERVSGRSRTRLLLLLLINISRVHCQGLTDTVLADLAPHLQEDASQLLEQSKAAADWGSIVSIRRSLQGTGFHRSLRLQIAPPATGSVPGCGLSLLQPLPSSIFADPYQLEDLTRTSTQVGYGYTFSLLGPLDLELPAPACEDTALLLGLNTSSWQQQQAGSATTLLVVVPLHAKYSQPFAAGFQGWHWTLTGHIAARLPWPYLLLDCRQQGGTLSLLQPPSSHQQLTKSEQQPQQCSSGTDGKHSQSKHRTEESSSSGGCAGADDGMLWLVPAGNLDHEVLVSWGTLLCAAVCCLAVSWSALRSSSSRRP